MPKRRSEPRSTAQDASCLLEVLTRQRLAEPEGRARKMVKRGVFVVLEGLDRTGKTTQCQRLVQRIQTDHPDRVVNGIRFPGQSILWCFNKARRLTRSEGR